METTALFDKCRENIYKCLDSNNQKAVSLHYDQMNIAIENLRKIIGQIKSEIILVKSHSDSEFKYIETLDSESEYKQK